MIGLKAQLGLIYPEIAVAFTMLFVFAADLVLGGDDEYEEVRASDTVALLGLVVALGVTVYILLAAPDGRGIAPEVLFSGSLVIDTFSQSMKALLLVATIFGLVAAFRSPEITTYRRAEHVAYVLSLLLGGMLVASASNLIMLYLAFEMLGIPSYIMAGQMRGSTRSSEAGFKYVLYGAGASGVMLFGFSYLYGMTGSLDLPQISHRLAAAVVTAAGHGGGGGAPVLSLGLLPIPILMVLAGLLYKVAAFPLHFWCPDVYEGAPLPITAIFSVIPKIGGFAVLVRFLYTFAQAMTTAATPSGATVDFGILTSLLAAIAALTMTVGNFSALAQTNIKRLLAYSGIANAGYLMMGVAIFGLDADLHGLMAVIFFLTVYVFANLGAFMVAVAINDQLGKESIADYAGLGRLEPWAGVSMAICLFSLVGMPPLGGFIAKFYLFYAVVQRRLWWLALVALGNSVVSLFYYARILKAMFLTDPPEGTTFELAGWYKWSLAYLVVPVLVLGIWFEPLAARAQLAARSFSTASDQALTPMPMN